MVVVINHPRGTGARPGSPGRGLATGIGVVDVGGLGSVVFAVIERASHLTGQAKEAVEQAGRVHFDKDRDCCR